MKLSTLSSLSKIVDKSNTWSKAQIMAAILTLQADLQLGANSILGDGLDLSNTELKHLDGVTSDIQTQLGLKALITDPTFIGEIGIGAVNVSEAELGKLEGILATTAELNRMQNASSEIQSQLNLKSPIANPTFTGVVTVAEIVSSTYKNIYAPATENPTLWSGIVHYAWDTVVANDWVVLSDTNGSLPADVIAWDSYSLAEKIVVNMSKFKIVLDNLLNGSSSSSTHTVRWYYSLDGGTTWILVGTATGITTTNTIMAAMDVTEVEFNGRDITGDVKFRLTQFRTSGSNTLDTNTLTVHLEAKIGAV